MLDKNKFIVLVLILLFSKMGPVSAGIKRNTNRKSYLPMEQVISNYKTLELTINEEDIELDPVIEGDEISLLINLEPIIEKYPANFRLDIYEYLEGNKTFVGSSVLTIINKRKARKALFEVNIGEFYTFDRELFFDLFDEDGIIVNSYKTTITSTNDELENQSNLTAAECDDESFGECQLKYILDKINFKVMPNRSLKTEVYREKNGSFTVEMPILSKKALGSSSSSKTSSKSNSTTLQTESNIQMGSQTSSFTMTYNELKNNMSFLFNDATKYSFNQSGKTGFGVVSPEALIHIKASDGTAPSIKIDNGSLTESITDGALEYDGQNLYFSIGSTREVVALGSGARGLPGATGATGPAGPAGPQGATGATGAAGSFSGGDATINGTLTFSGGGDLFNAVLNGTSLFKSGGTAKFNGSILIPSGASNGYVLTSDANGNATWQASAGGGGGGNGTPAIGASGTVQFSVGSGTLGGDANNLFWNNSNDRLGIGTNSPSTSLDVNGTVTALSFAGSGANITGITASGIADDTIDFEDIADSLALDANTSVDLNGYDLNVNGGLLMLDSSANGVGIGTITPSTALQVVGTVTATSFAGSGASITGITSSGIADDTITLEDVADSLALDATTTLDLNGSDLNVNGGLLMLDSSANGVGIGTITPSTALQVVGTVTATAFSGNGSALTGISTSVSNDSLDFDHLEDSLALDATTTLDLNGSDLNVNGGLLMLDSSANGVGIGTITPSTALQVVGTVTATAFSGNGSALTGISTSVSNDSLDFDHLEDSLALDATTTLDLNGSDLNVNGGLLMLDSSANGVGIGTITPSTALQVVGTVTATSFAGDASNLTGITVSSMSNDTIDFEAIGDTLALDATTTVDLNGSDLNFNGGMLILDSSTSNVGIGTTTPSQKLEVNGDLQVNETFVYDTVHDNSTASGTLTIDWNNGNRQKVTLNGNITDINITDPPGPGSFSILVIQDGTGSRTISSGSWSGESTYWPSGTAPTMTTTASATDLITCVYDGTNYFCSISLDLQAL